MDKEDLIDYLKSQLNTEFFRNGISKELESFRNSLKEKGRSARIVYNGDRSKTNITKAHLKKICSDYSNSLVDDLFVSYIVDALLLSENSIFETEELREKFELLTDFEINGKLTKERMSEICGSQPGRK